MEGAGGTSIQIGQWHAILVYLPLALFIGALVADILNYFGRAWAFKLGHVLIVLGVVTCIPAITTGLAAAENYDPTNLFLIKHSSLGYTTGVCGSLYAGLRLSAWWWGLPLLPVHYLGFSALMVALVLWASDYGGLVEQSKNFPKDLEWTNPNGRAAMD